MTSYFLGREETRAYARDFLTRLQRFEKLPTVWCPITKSGLALLKVLVTLVEEEFPKLRQIDVVSIEMDDGNQNIRFVGGEKPDALRGQSVLLLDGAIHSGNMMTACAEAVLECDPAELSSYALVVKRGSAFIPTLWGLLINESDRAFFLLDKLPNNRLDAAGHNAANTKKQPLVHIARLSERMVKTPPIECEVPSMDRATWSDRHFQMVASNHHTCTYLLQRGKTTLGYLTMHLQDDGSLMIDEVAIDKNQQGHGYGGVLIRFADTLARQGNCPAVRLRAIKEKVEFYLRFNYRHVSPDEPIILDTETYFLMEKAVLNHGPLGSY